MDDRERFYLFWGVCIPLRITLGALAIYFTLMSNPTAFYAVGTFCSLVAVGFAANVVLTLVGKKTRGALGGRVWWNKSRIIHFMLYALCAVLCFVKVKGCGVFILLDAIVGCCAGLIHFLWKKP